MSRHDEEEAAAWRERAEELGATSMLRFVNRSDIWGAYNPMGVRPDRGSARTAPARRDRGKYFLTPNVLARHYRAQRPEHRVGVHAISETDTCRWFALDFDQHKDRTAAEVILANRDAAIRVSELLSSVGLHSLVEDSNGNGGFHLWCFVATPLPAAEVFAFCRALIDAAELPPETECFPKQASAKNAFGNWLRLPGRHHDGRPHWSRFWAGNEWLKGKDAVNYLLNANQ
jgi:hypothetical protein